MKAIENLCSLKPRNHTYMNFIAYFIAGVILIMLLVYTYRTIKLRILYSEIRKMSRKMDTENLKRCIMNMSFFIHLSRNREKSNRVALDAMNEELKRRT